MDLMRAWARLLPPLAGVDDVTFAGARILQAHEQPHRHYHDLRHLTEVLTRIDELAPFAHDADLVRLAAWFHDVVYEPARTDNEDISAAVAERVLLDLGVAPPRRAATARLVRLTATHYPAGDDPDGAVLCDADLAVLGADSARYAEYCADVRREYAHLADEAFAAGRAEVLRQLIARESLFRTSLARSRWEARARTNVELELDRLSRAGGDPTHPAQ